MFLKQSLFTLLLALPLISQAGVISGAGSMVPPPEKPFAKSCKLTISQHYSINIPGEVGVTTCGSSKVMNFELTNQEYVHLNGANLYTLLPGAIDGEERNHARCDRRRFLPFTDIIDVGLTPSAPIKTNSSTDNLDLYISFFSDKSKTKIRSMLRQELALNTEYVKVSTLSEINRHLRAVVRLECIDK